MELRSIFVFAFLVATLSVIAQNDKPNFQKEIDEQVWNPFRLHFMAYNTQQFMALHDTSMKRVLVDNNRVRTYWEYANQNRRGDSASKAAGNTRTIEFKFTKRVANDNFAFEEGYYKSENTKSNGERSVFYGKFWVTLRKINGVWKITMDADSSKGITEEMFNTGN
jgi:hypothetical protein